MGTPVTIAHLEAVRVLLQLNVPDDWTIDRPRCVDDLCAVCDDVGTEIARGVFWMHPRCVRRVANFLLTIQIAAMAEPA
jgi:hypothetical protein